MASKGIVMILFCVFSICLVFLCGGDGAMYTIRDFSRHNKGSIINRNRNQFLVRAREVTGARFPGRKKRGMLLSFLPRGLLVPPSSPAVRHNDEVDSLSGKWTRLPAKP